MFSKHPLGRDKAYIVGTMSEAQWGTVIGGGGAAAGGGSRQGCVLVASTWAVVMLLVPLDF